MNFTKVTFMVIVRLADLSTTVKAITSEALNDTKFYYK